jgi:hypothetical protein
VCIAIRAPQSKDWIVTWSLIPASRISSQTRRTNRARGAGLLRSPRLDLGLDVEHELLGLVALDEVEQIAQLDHRPAHYFLVREVGQRLVAAVEGLDLREGEIGDEPADVRELGVAWEGRRSVLALHAADLSVVADDHLLVLGDLGVELEGGDTEFDRFGETPERAFGGQADAAAVCLDIEAGLLWWKRVSRGRDSQGDAGDSGHEGRGHRTNTKHAFPPTNR